MVGRGLQLKRRARSEAGHFQIAKCAAHRAVVEAIRGRGLSQARRLVLNRAKIELRKAYGRAAKN
jgi:hypothetical protein